MRPSLRLGLLRSRLPALCLFRNTAPGLFTLLRLVRRSSSRQQVRRVSPIVQVVFESYATETTTTSTSYVTSGLTATITPTLNTSKVLVMATCVVENGTGQNAFATVFRGTVADTNLYGATGFLAIQEDSANRLGGGAGNFLDSPATTSATTYTLAFKGSGANTTLIQAENTTSTLTLMEIKV
jgi:hypothetical protein